MNTMLGSSLPLGKLFGVDVRLHLSFALLLAVSMGAAVLVGSTALRGFGLWFALLLAVVVREVARALGAAYSGLELRALFLFPVGGLMAFAPRRNSQATPSTGLVSAAGPAGNIFAGLLLLSTAYAFQPSLGLFQQPWFSFAHILRSVVWMQFMMAALGMLPAALPERKLFARKGSAPPPAAAPSLHLGSMLAVALALGGLATMNLWMIALGALLFLLAQINTAQNPANAPSAAASNDVTVREVMLTEYTLLSASDTLTGALAQTAHSLQDVFPVVRGDRLVGAVSRSTLIENLQAQGDGYLQGLMTRTLHSAAPEEPLVDALQRSAALGASELIPVVEDDGMLGILTSQGLVRGVPLMKTQRASRPDEA